MGKVYGIRKTISQVKINGMFADRYRLRAAVAFTYERISLSNLGDDRMSAVLAVNAIT